MNCENPVFRACAIITEGIYPTSKELRIDGSTNNYIIQFKFNGKEVVQIDTSKLEDENPQISIFTGGQEPILNSSNSQAFIPISIITDLTQDILIVWQNSDLNGPITHGDKISSCTIKFEDARPPRELNV